MSLFHRLEHLRYRRLLDASVDGELTGELARRVRAHLSGCPQCGRDEEFTIAIKRRLARFRLLRSPMQRE